VIPLEAIMFVSDPPHWLWSIWPSLSVMNRLFFLVLSAITVYCLLSATIILVRFRYIRKEQPTEDPISIQRSAAALHNRSANVRQVIGATTYLFGVVFFLGLQSAPRTLGHSASPLGMEVLPTFVLLFAFAANVFLVLLALHLVSWFVCSRVNSSLLHSNARHLA
jgi:hypothetical protein